MKADNKSSILPLAWRCERKPEKEELRRALRFMKVGGYEWHYAVYRSHSHSPQEEGYLVQIRIVSRFALRSMFHVLSDEEYSLFPTQRLSIGEFIWHFIEEQERV